MKKLYKFSAILLIISLLFGFLGTGNTKVQASSIYSEFYLSPSNYSLTIYTNQPVHSFQARLGYSTMKYSASALDSASKKIRDDLVFQSSDASIVSFVTYTHNAADGKITYDTTNKLTTGKNGIQIIGLSEGTATITMKSRLLNSSYKTKITVKDAELFCEDTIFYNNNTYNFTMNGNASAIRFTSSNEAVATVNASTGAVKTKKTGTTTISCVADNGKTYTQKMKIQKCGLSYTKLTTYYYTGFRKGCYTYFPLVAKGIDVKNWKSSNKKICKVINLDSLGKLQMRGTGKCTITCTSTEGKKYKCKLTVVGGKKWGGLSGGYQPTLSTLKKHGYFKDIDSVKDYGDVIVIIQEYDRQIKLGNGNKQLPDNIEQLTLDKHPGKYYTSSWGDYLCFKSNDGKKYGRLRVSWYYLSEQIQ